MRQIKFRAWMKHSNKMFSFNDCIDHGWNFEDLRDNDVDSFMQFTGLLDKNGKEIYEGDIVAALSRIGQVSYHEERAAFIFNDTFNELLFQGIGFDAEIIGNIHEHPELI